MGESVGLIYKKISSVMADIGSIGKERSNKEQGYKFRGIEDLYNAAHPAMVKHGVFCAPSVLEYESGEYQTASGKRMLRMIMRVQHRFYAEDGSFVDVVTTGEGADQSDKAANKCLSAAFKYALVELFCVPTEDIEDADRTTPGEEQDRRLPTEPKSFVKPAAGTEAPSATQPKRRIRMPKETQQPAETEGSPSAATGADAYITLEKQDYLRMRFVAALPAQYRSGVVAESMRKGWLKSEGFLNEDGEGTSSRILDSQYRDVFKRMLTWAESQAVASSASQQQPDDDIPS